MVHRREGYIKFLRSVYFSLIPLTKTLTSKVSFDPINLPISRYARKL